MSKRLQGVIVGVIAGALLAGGVAYAVTVVPPNSTDRYYACVGILGRVKADTLRLNSPPATCPKALDTVRSWNAQGPKGDPGQSAPAPAVSLIPDEVTVPASVPDGTDHSQDLGGPTVTVNVPASGLVNLTLAADIKVNAVPAGQYNYCGYAGVYEGSVPVPRATYVHACSTPAAGVFYTDLQSGTVQLSPGTHQLSLRYDARPPGQTWPGGSATFRNRKLVAQVVG